MKIFQRPPFAGALAWDHGPGSADAVHPAALACLTPQAFCLDQKEHGVFSPRAPARPNPIGLSVVTLLRVEGQVLEIENVDVLDGTPLLDIKPYVLEFDHFEVERTGWLAAARGSAAAARSDDRFR